MSDSSVISSPSENNPRSDNDLVYPTNTEENDLKDSYPAFSEFEAAFKQYQRDTFQTFVVRRSESLGKTHPKADTLKYKKIEYECVHHKDYEKKGQGERIFTHSRKQKCPAIVKVAASIREATVRITKKEVGHNHPLTEERWKGLPENRRLSTTEADKVVSMQKSFVPTKAIQREMAKQTGKAVTSKDIINIRTKHDKVERGGRTEEEMVNHILNEIRRKDAGVFIDIVVSDAQKVTNITIITSEMQKNFNENYSLAFLDGTYKLNVENYCLYAVVVQDRHGHGRPVALGFMSSEKAAHVDAFFNAFKACHKT
ncbi:uncharacterized protein LOC129595277 [Paramacrobiotus metropolitanus]|uniref:uncharacterized protein LOC129595277 n=1 Tax=Paramacrobiotus metropolitanus TaxID=2943436 RepID=UPI0024461CD2|nr:uncharacterized protein LOC129595277 [Paramacrobiotus metropolitanus]